LPTGRPDQQHIGGVFDKAQGAQFVDDLLSTEGWAEKSKSAKVNGEGKGAKRARLIRRRLSTEATSRASSRSD